MWKTGWMLAGTFAVVMFLVMQCYGADSRVMLPMGMWMLFAAIQAARFEIIDEIRNRYLAIANDRRNRMHIKDVILEVLDEAGSGVGEDRLLIRVMERQATRPISWSHFQECIERLTDAKQIEYRNTCFHRVNKQLAAEAKS